MLSWLVPSQLLGFVRCDGWDQLDCFGCHCPCIFDLAYIYQVQAATIEIRCMEHLANLDYLIDLHANQLWVYLGTHITCHIS